MSPPASEPTPRPAATLPAPLGVRRRAPGVTATLLRFLLPSPCLGCGGLDPPLDQALGLCPACRGRLSAVTGPRCRRCLRSLPGGSEAASSCPRCSRGRGGLDRLLAGWHYAPPLDAVLRGLKFGGLAYLGRDLAAARAGRLRTELAAADLVVPVPLHWWRQLGRGYNQAAEIARPLARRLGRPCRTVLSRRRATSRQAELPRSERTANVRRAFVVRRPALARGRVCLLVDDVVTTGATLTAAATALRRAGAAAVLAVAAARTPEPHERAPGPRYPPE